MRPNLLRAVFIYCITFSLLSCKQNKSSANTTPVDLQRINILINHGKQHETVQIDSLTSIAQQLNQLATTTGNKKALVYAKDFMAHNYWMSADHKTSMEMAVKCLADAEKYNITDAYPDIYGVISNLHKENTNYTLAFDANDKGLSWAYRNHDTSMIIGLLSNKGMLIHTQREALNFPLNDSSVNLQFKALTIAKSNAKYEQRRTVLYDNISQYYLDNKNYSQAITYGDTAIALGLKYNRQRSLTYSYIWLGKAYFNTGNRKKGLDYINKSLHLAHDLKLPYREMEIYNDLYDCYYSIGDYKKAIGFNRISQEMNDSLRVYQNEKQMSELQLKYETAKKDRQLTFMDHSQSVKNGQIIAMLAGSFICVVLFFILYLQYTIIRKNNDVIRKSHDKKDQALVDIAFIQSHELRKPLASILGLINVIKTSDIIDEECLFKLEQAAKELDIKIHDVLNHVHEAN